MKLVWFKSLALLLLLSSGSFASEQIAFPSSSTYYGKEVTLNGTLRTPKKAAQNPVVILLHGCGGLAGAVRTSLYSHANYLHENGFATLVLDSFTPRGIKSDWVCRKLSRLGAARGYRQRDVVDAIRYLETRNDIDTGNVFLMGQSNGGSVAALMTYGKISRHIRAAAAFYPWCGAVPFKPLVPLIVFAGEKDDWTPPDECLARAPGSPKIKLTVYPDATHSFDLPIPAITVQGHRLEGNPGATNDSQARMTRFFQASLVKAD